MLLLLWKGLVTLLAVPTGILGSPVCPICFCLDQPGIPTSFLCSLITAHGVLGFFMNYVNGCPVLSSL